MAKLTTEMRKKIPAREFAGLDRTYPIPDKHHAANAKARASEEYNKGNLTKAQEDRIDRKADRKLHGVKEHELEHWGQ